MKRTMAQLKRDANEGKMSLELIERYGKTGENIPERIRGKRRVFGANTVALKIARADDPTKESELQIRFASLIDYDGESLTIFEPGARALTPDEKRVFEEARRIVDEYQRKYPYSDGWYYKEKYYIENSEFPYLFGEGRNGKRVIYPSGEEPMLCDPLVRGQAILKYKVIFD